MPPNRRPMSPQDPLELALKHHAEGKLSQAEGVLRRAVQASPGNQRATFWLGRILFDSGQFAQSVYFLERASALDPKHPDSLGVATLALLAMGKLDEAEKKAKRLLEVIPENPGALNNLGLVYVQRGQLVDAVECFGRAIKRAPEPARALRDAVSNFALVTNQLGRADEAMEMLESIVKRDPGNDFFLLSLASVVTYSSATPRRAFEAHRDLGRLYPTRPRPPARPLDVGGKRRKLRVGLVSPDFRRHSVAYFIEPILAHRDPSIIEYYCYSATPQPDDMTVRLKSLADGWRDIAGKLDADAAETIVRDQVDVLIDLAGHTSGNRLAMMMLRPAPVLVTYLGYANTTGLGCMDRRIVDDITDPSPDADSFAIEKLERLPGCFLCYSPSPAPPPRHPAPADSPITFGSFNAAAKLSPRVLDAWSNLLNDLPDARLVLKASSLTEPAAQAWFSAQFARRGVQAGRVRFVPFAKQFSDHLAIYATIDIALDTFPYAGTTTTCEALSMGVPVVTLAEPFGIAGHAGRVGASLLTAAGHPELIASTTAEYLAIAKALAGDRERLAGYHASLPAALRASPLCDARAFSRTFDAALLRIFDQTIHPA